MSGTKSIEEVIVALKAQLESSSELVYAKDSGWVGEEPSVLIATNKFPFFNLDPINQSVKAVPGMSFKQMKRNTYQIMIQFAQQSDLRNGAVSGTTNKVGIMQFSTDIMDAILEDETLGDVVNGLEPLDNDRTINIDFLTLEDEEKKRWIAGGEMTLWFYADEPVLI